MGCRLRSGPRSRKGEVLPPSPRSPMSSLPVTHATIASAHALIAPHIRRTPVMELPRGALGGDWTPVLKCEFMQHAGSFKPRGAFYNLLSRAVGPAGVAAASGGNHGAATAYAAARLGHKARIFVPEISSPAKVAAIRRFGADVVIAARAMTTRRRPATPMWPRAGAEGASLRRGRDHRRPGHAGAGMAGAIRPRQRADRGGRRRADRRRRELVRGHGREGRRRRAEGLAGAACGAGGRRAGRRHG